MTWNLIEFSAEEIVKLATEIEKSGQNFYTSLASKTDDKKAKDVLQFLANEEGQHIKDFEALGAELANEITLNEQYAGEYVEYLNCFIESHIFNQSDTEELVNDIKDAKDALEMALRFEKDSIVIFQLFLKAVGNKGKEVIGKLIEEELGHIKKLALVKKEWINLKTKENLMAAFAGESQANRKYMAFAQKAQREGKDKISRLFTAVADAETIHALKHFDTASKVADTLANVKSAVEGETYESNVMYPQFIKEAKEEENIKAVKSFELAMGAEKSHAKLFQKALGDLEDGKDMTVESLYLCPVCGYIEADHAPERCPVCGAKGSSFKEY